MSSLSKANALFVLYTEATLGVRCDAIGSEIAQKSAAEEAGGHSSGRPSFYSNRYHSNSSTPGHFQGVVATVSYDSSPSLTDVDKKIKTEIMDAIFKREQQRRRDQAKTLQKQ